MTPLLPVIVPFGAAAISLALGRRHALRRSLGVLALVANLVASVLLLQEVRDGSVVTVVVGDWPAPIGIGRGGPVLGDHAVGRLADAAGRLRLRHRLLPHRRHHPLLPPVYLLLASGVSASFVTGDLFNLFVAFEMTLVCSYVLITLGGSKPQVRHGTTYVVISLLASTLFVTAVGLVYAATGPSTWPTSPSSSRPSTPPSVRP